MIDRDPTPSAALREEFDLRLASLDLPKRLRPYQSEGVLFLATAESALLADEMGLGKTVQAIVAVKLLVIQHPSARVLVVVPKSLKRNWSDEFRSVGTRTLCPSCRRESNESDGQLPFALSRRDYDIRTTSARY